ncbi:hypothetical protein SMSP2_01371 [Limihaloglobus sulfuriphilus]|uniref:DUF3604 domain-containing protein n=1 Tax=Limihaloglobus sulfuriphilus TaxID=1851148 RepID=A0A1Q2MFD5_9BACT|nr:DUF3604 domain-containing protein [Limihaloglobus sulfuriphilus]AQQ71007.1 hypothetical protein SMSP2_01371 [Limihaloglobus sulfuriphilus]
MYNPREINRRDFIAGMAGIGASAMITSMLASNGFAVSANQAGKGSDKLEWPLCSEDFSAMSLDKSGRLWTVNIEFLAGDKRIGVYCLDKNNIKHLFEFKIAGMTGISSPAIAAFGQGCVICFPVEIDDKWQIAYSFVTAKTDYPAIKFIKCPGNSNISPAVAVTGDKACIIWESNAQGKRAIYSCFAAPKSADMPQRISDENANSYNPAVVSLSNGDIFAAWDSLRDTGADIYGARYRGGSWEEEYRITSDSRIERHPYLSVHNNEIWMAWQAQSYKGKAINNVTEQRIAAARIDGEELLGPKNLFVEISTDERFLLRPRIAFDNSGRLWLTARESISYNAGWLAKIWCYSGSQWSEPRVLLDNQGRWRPVEIAVNNDGDVLTSIQYDNLPKSWDFRPHGDRKSGISIETTPTEQKDSNSKPVLEPLKMPETEFSLTDKMAICSAELPREKVRHNGRQLSAFFGDFHDHTDLSVCNRRLNPPGHDLFANERDIEKLDFCATTDHDFDYDRPQWQFNGEQTRQNHDPGRFVTFLAQEWTSSQNQPATPEGFCRYGHHNLIFLDPYHKRFYNAYAGDISPRELWKQLEKDKVDFICIPHQLADWQHKGKANPPKDWNYVDEKYQPVAEIFQTRASYEYLGCPRQSGQGAPFKGNYLQDAWEKGIIIGVIASPDHGGGNGKVGVWAESLTRKDIFEAVKARHTFGTSCPKMSLFFRSNEAIMGDKTQKRSGAIPFEIRATALQDIKEVVIFRNNSIVYKAQPLEKKIEINWIDENPAQDSETLWYYTRIQTKGGELAWSSPIWFVLH